MDSKNFLSKYHSCRRPIKDVASGWLIARALDDFKGSTILSGVQIEQYFSNKDIKDSIPADVLKAFELLHKEKGDELHEIQQILHERFKEDPQALQGYMNNILGRIGEIRFHEQMGDLARLPQSPSQIGYDIIINAPEGARYVSVKIYQDADGVIQKIRQTRDYLAEGKVLDGNTVVSEIEFAVNRDIYDEVVHKVELRDLDVKILPVDITHAKAREMLESTVEACSDALGSAVAELAGVVATAATFHLAANILMWRCRKKELHEALTDTVFESAGSAGGIASASAVRWGLAEGSGLVVCETSTLAGVLFGPVGFCAGLVAAYSTRRILKDLTDRGKILVLIEDSNERLHTRLQLFTRA